MARRSDRSYVLVISNRSKEMENGHPSMRRMLAQADMEGKSLYAVCSRGSLGPDLFLTGLTASCLPQ